VAQSELATLVWRWSSPGCSLAGKYGILNEADIYTKDSEFRAWLIGEKVSNPSRP
jgi:hypothetical protein